MTVIRPNSVSGINSITAQANEIKIFKSDGTQGGLVIGGANLNATSGISTVAALTVTGNVSVGGTLTYQDVTNIDSVGIVTSRNIIFSGSTGTPGQFVLRRDSDGANIGQFRSDAGTNDISIGNGGSGSLILKTGANTERLRITSGGKIGLDGMTNPVAKLHIGTEDDSALTAQTVFVEGAKTGYANYTGLPQNQLCLYDNTVSTAGSGGAISFAANCGGSQQTWIAAIESQRDSSTNDASNYAGSIVFWTRPAQSTPTEKLRITSSGHVLPGANNTYDLGSTAKGWRNVYMNDLNLSNMNGDTNDVDGTQGSWTIQEGKDNLYIINRLNGKKFKIKMEEIS